MLQIVLLRHAESEANRRHQLASRALDPALTPQGRSEVVELAQGWPLLTAIYASPLRRSRETADIFAGYCGISGYQVDDRLREIELGSFDGQTLETLKAQQGERFRRWKQDPEDPPPGGEKLSAVARRMREFMDAVVARESAGVVVVITHADGLKALTLDVLGAPWHSAQALHFANLAGICVTPNGAGLALLGLAPWPRSVGRG